MANGSLAVGVTLCFIGNVTINVGTILMKIGHNHHAEAMSAKKGKTKIYEHKAWLLGTGLFILGNIFNFSSFSFAAQSLLSALGTIQFVSNVVFGKVLLKEPITVAKVVSTGCIILGCVIMAFFGSHVTHTYTADMLRALYKEKAYRIYLLIAAISVLCSWAGYRFIRTQTQLRGEDRMPRWMLSISPILYAFFSALIGTQSVLLSKTVSELVSTTIRGKNQFKEPFTYVAILGLLFTGGFWVSKLNRSLALFPAAVIIPVMQIFWTVLSVISGGIYFKEFSGFSPVQVFMFILGLIITLSGVTLLTVAQSRLDRQRAIIAQGQSMIELAEAGEGDTKLAKKPSLEHLVPEGHDGLGLGPGAAAGMDEYYDDFNTDSSQEINSSATSFTRQRTFNRIVDTFVAVGSTVIEDFMPDKDAFKYFPHINDTNFHGAQDDSAVPTFTGDFEAGGLVIRRTASELSQGSPSMLGDDWETASANSRVAMMRSQTSM